jgi:hypothetical protein
MITRIFLAIVGLAYLILAGWCAAQPAQTSASVGFSLQKGSGQSEFLTVYGGLEFALGFVFLWPLVRLEQTSNCLMLCLWIQACLVLFRTCGFFSFSEIPTTTYALASVEWVIFLGSLGLWWSNRDVI